jgi:hypothetical protein
VVVVEEAHPSDTYGDTTMIFIGILLSMAAIGFLCWLLFTLAVFALPFFAGVTAGTWAYGTGAGWLGAIVVGVVAAGLTFGAGQLLLAIIRPTWAHLLIAAAFRPSRDRRLPCHPWHREAHHAVRGLAAYLLDHRGHCGRHRRFRPHHRNGGARPFDQEPVPCLMQQRPFSRRDRELPCCPVIRAGWQGDGNGSVGCAPPVAAG